MGIKNNDDVELTEITDFEAIKVSGVPNPANATPWLLMKSESEIDEEPSPQTKEPIGSEDEMAKMLEDALTKGFCGEEDCAACQENNATLYKELATKAVLKTKVRDKLPNSTFAYISPNGDRKLPLTDASHVRNALARFNQTQFDSESAKAKAARKIKAKAKALGIDLSAHTAVTEAAKSTGVPKRSTKVPKKTPVISQSAHSGVNGPLTAGTQRLHDDPSYYLGGQSPYRIPIEDAANTIKNHRRPKHMNRQNEASPVTIIKSRKEKKRKKTLELPNDLNDALEIVRKANWAADEPPTPAQSESIGDSQWEQYDSESLDAAARGLAIVSQIVDNIRKREQIEAVNGDIGDIADTQELIAASNDLQSALGLIARLAYHEQAGEHKLAPTAQKAQYEEPAMTTITTDELNDLIAKKANKIAKKQTDKAIKALNKKIKKNANNGGDISASQMTANVKGHYNANDVNGIPDGGKVESQYINKPKGKAKKKLEEDVKRVESIVKNLSTTLTNISNAPMPGGPMLRGQFPKGLNITDEGRISLGSATAPEDEISVLTKQLEEAKDPQVKERLGHALTYKKLLKGYETGALPLPTPFAH
jgi:hypothetical protein